MMIQVYGHDNATGQLSVEKSVLRKIKGWDHF